MTSVIRTLRGCLRFDFPQPEESVLEQAAREAADKVELLGRKIDALEGAINFLDRCRASPAEASEAGCFSDAHAWLESAAREVVSTHRELLKDEL